MKKRTRVIALLMGIIMLLGLLAGCGSNTDGPADPHPASPGEQDGQKSADTQTAPADSVQREVVSIGSTSEPNTYFPYAATSTSADYVFDFIYDRLVYTDFNGEFTPRLADSWESNDDGTVITFHLNKNVTWHDGEPFTAQDMVFSAQMATNPDTTVTRRSYFASLVGKDDSGVCADPEELGVVAVDDYTLEYHFKTGVAVSTFLYVDAQRYYPMPYHLLKDIPCSEIESNSYWQSPIGTGPFQFESAVSGESATLAANPNYFLGAPHMNKVVFKFLVNTSLAAALMSGDLDVSISDVPMSDVGLLQQDENLAADPLPSYKYTYMTINCEKEYFQDIRVRKAINMAINREEIVQQGLYGFGDIATHSLNRDNPYFNTNIDHDPYDPEGAKALLEEAGWDFDRELVFISYETNAARAAATLVIQQNLEAIGMKVRIQNVDWSTLIDMVREGESDLSILGGAGSLDPDDSRVLLQVGGAQNFCHIQDPRFYELSQAGHNALTDEEKRTYYHQLQQEMYDDPTYIWLYHDNTTPVYNKSIQNVPIEDFLNLNFNSHTWTFAQ